MDWTRIVAVDGGALSGKTTVCREVAKRLGYGYLNTGAIYRCVALALVGAGEISQEAAVSVARSMEVQLTGDPDSNRVIMDGLDVTDLIRSPEVTMVVSKVSSYKRVREFVRIRQLWFCERMMSDFGGVVADGRDSTSMLFPQASVRLILTPSKEWRTCVEASSGKKSVKLARERDLQDSQVSNFVNPACGVLARITTPSGLPSLIEEIVSLAVKARR